MKTTRKFLRSKRYLNTYFVYVWSRFVGEDGKVFGKKKRMYHKCSPHARIFLLQLDRMKCPLRMSIDSLELRLRKP
jgi:hypothetical protein